MIMVFLWMDRKDLSPLNTLSNKEALQTHCNMQKLLN